MTRNSSGRYADKERGASDSYKQNTSSSHTSGSAGGSFMGFGASAGYHTGSAHEDDKTTTKRTAIDVFKNTATNLTISLEYGMVDIIRPWLLGDLFYMKNWYMIGQKKNLISDGTIAGQALNEDTLLPMTAMQFLVVRNVKISTKQWGSDGHTLQSMFGDGGGAWDQSSSGFNASASYGFGPISCTASVSHDQAKAGVSRYGNFSSTDRQDFEASFDGETLEIKGAQIVAWLSTIVPATPPLDDPMLGKTAAPAAAAAAPAAAAPAAAQPALAH